MLANTQRRRGSAPFAGNCRKRQFATFRKAGGHSLRLRRVHCSEDRRGLRFTHSFDDIEQDIHLKSLENPRGIFGFHRFVNFHETFQLRFLLLIVFFKQALNLCLQRIQVGELCIQPFFGRREAPGPAAICRVPPGVSQDAGEPETPPA